MKYLLDTNIVSEFYKPSPHIRVRQWLKKQTSSTIYLSVITIGEIRYGIEKKRKKYPNMIDRHVDSLLHMELAYAGRILPFDQKAAHIWGQITSHYPNHPMDAQIASIALANDAILVTRNIKDFRNLAFGMPLQLINPFNEEK